MIRIGLQWFAMQTGDAASAHLEAGGFIRSMPGVEYPDIQFHFLTARLLSNSIRLVNAFTSAVIFFLLSAGRKYAEAALHLLPLWIVISIQPTPSCWYPFMSSVNG
jgi:choline dehydrogenase-like flavoprotein